MITIVTSRNFLICESINHISLHKEDIDGFNLRGARNGYLININFNALSRNNNQSNGGFGSKSNEDLDHVSIRVVGEKVALRFFKEIVAQIREQTPDAAYLDKMVENLLKGDDIHDDPSTAETDRTRPKKRRNKKVLRGAKSSSNRRKK